MQDTLFELHEQKPQDRTWHKEILESLAVDTSSCWPDSFGKSASRWLQEHNHKSISTLSLFSGGGGLDIAFHDAGFNVVEMVEIEAKFAATLTANSQPGRLLEGAVVVNKDIRDYTPAEGLNVDFIIGGPPCQTFSAAGRRAAGVRGTNDPRGTLFQEYVRILKQLTPKGFLFENVYGITGAQGGEAWKQIQEGFKAAGYSIFYRVLDSADYGVPQHRERLFIVGLKEGTFQFPYPTHGPDSVGEQPFYTASEATATADKTGASIGIGGRYGHLLKDIPPGLNYSFYTKELGHPSPVFSWRSKFSDFLYKAAPDTPVRTIKAQGGQYTGPFSWENRPFTVAELKRLQTFPDDYEIVGGQQACVHQIGNSVPPQIGRMLALSVLNQVMGITLPFPMHYLPQGKQLNFRQRKRSLTAVYSQKARTAIKQLYTSDAISKLSNVQPSDMRRERFLSQDFSWSEVETPNSARICLGLNFSEIEWSITAGLRNHEKERYAFEVVVSSGRRTVWCLGNRVVRLRGIELNERVFTGLWKAFEEVLREAYGVADLVQLSGYYQYEPQIRAELQLLTEQQPNSFWKVLSSVVNGVAVAKQISASQLSLLWDVEEGEVLQLLKALRAMGYEVRNHSTNPTIPVGEYLIPYAFPTFNPKSVQLRKTLEAEAEYA